MAKLIGPTPQLILGGSSTAPTLIVRDNLETVALVDVRSTAGAAGVYVQLPADALVGDLVEVYWARMTQPDTSPGPPRILAQSGETFQDGSMTSVTGDSSWLRKCSTSIWAYGA